MTSAYRADADAAFFLARQLEKVKAKSYEQRFENLKGRVHFPPGSEPSGPGAETFTYEYYSSVGLAKVVSSYASDFPIVDVKTEEFPAMIKSLGAAYSYSFQEIRNAMFAGKDLISRKAIAARRSIAEKEDALIYFGSAADGLLGVLNNPNIPIVSLPYAVAAGSTADQIIETFNTLINTPIQLTNGVESVDTVLMTVEAFTYIRSVRIPDTNITIFKMLQDAHPGVDFDWCTRLKGQGTGGVDLTFAYKRDEEHVYTEIASDFEQLPPDDNGRVTTINCHERFGGVVIPYPLAFAKGEMPA